MPEAIFIPFTGGSATLPGTSPPKSAKQREGDRDFRLPSLSFFYFLFLLLVKAAVCLANPPCQVIWCSFPLAKDALCR